jgi:hypothetical protein
MQVPWLFQKLDYPRQPNNILRRVYSFLGISKNNPLNAFIMLTTNHNGLPQKNSQSTNEEHTNWTEMFHLPSSRLVKLNSTT